MPIQMKKCSCGKYYNNATGKFCPFCGALKERAICYHLKCVDGEFAGKDWEIDSEIIIGRDSSCCKIVFSPDAEGISRVHMSVSVQDHKIVLKDLGSSYGTTLDDGSVLQGNQQIIVDAGTGFVLGRNRFEIQK